MYHFLREKLNIIKEIIIKNNKKENYPLIKVVIDSGAILKNFQNFREFIPKDKIIAPVLKSIAYGHGLIEVAEILSKNKLGDFFIIDSFFEAMTLRKKGIDTPLLIIGFVETESFCKTSLKNISLTIVSLDQLYSINNFLNQNKIKKQIKIHLKIDTGMNRQGIRIENISEALEIIKNQNNLKLEGICSHFAESDSTNEDFTLKQIEKWNNLVEMIKKDFKNIKYIHISNSSGVNYFEKINANTIRLGGALYGLTLNAPIENKIKYYPALSVYTLISGIKKIKKGESIGYSKTFTASKDMTIATIPIGYNEGFKRNINLGKRNNNFYPLVGRISMNIATIDISDNFKKEDLKFKEEVCVFSNKISDENSLQKSAEKIDTLSYELAVKMSPLLKRIVK